ncbi:MAG: hypothetical protein Q9177_000931 [Variospora cf. flavescens]
MGEELPICVACGTQYDAGHGNVPFECKICEVQYVHNNLCIIIALISKNPGSTSVCAIHWTAMDQPIESGGETLEQVGAKPVQSQHMVYMDRTKSTLVKIGELGGLKAIVISHPHFYTTYIEWADYFSCSVYMAADDQEWICRKPTDPKTIKLIEGPSETILENVTAIKAGGHFPGSLVLHWDDQLFIADTIMTVPSAHSPHPRPPGQTSYSFQWSIPNMIPLGPKEITQIWKSIKLYDFHTTYGAFNGMTVRDKQLKQRVFESMITQLRREGEETPFHTLAQ